MHIFKDYRSTERKWEKQKNSPPPSLKRNIERLSRQPPSPQLPSPQPPSPRESLQIDPGSESIFAVLYAVVVNKSQPNHILLFSSLYLKMLSFDVSIQSFISSFHISTYSSVISLNLSSCFLLCYFLFFHPSISTHAHTHVRAQVRWHHPPDQWPQTASSWIPNGGSDGVQSEPAVDYQVTRPDCRQPIRHTD